MNDSIFLFSHRDRLPDQYFIGHAFVGSDLVVGNEGATQFARETGRFVEPGEDGCYVTIEKRDGQHVIGVDFCGYTKLFVYRSGTRWAVSNSIVELIEYAKSHGLPLTIDVSQFESWHIGGVFGRQLATYKTVAREICLLPSHDYLVVTQDALTKRTRPARRRLAYQDALKAFLSRWVSRASTIASDSSLRAVIDLSGGIDSRTVAALFIHVGREFQRPNIVFRSEKGERKKTDYLTAQMLARKYSLALNTRRDPGLVLLCPDPYCRWKSLCVGSYAPIYFPEPRIDADAIFFSGGGGEAHRPFYPMVSPEEYLHGYQKYFRSNRLFRSWREAVLDSLGQRQGVAPHPLSYHYREFRNRFHAGRIANYKTSFAPLASLYLLDCTAAYDAPDFATHQVLFDVMENLCPGLMMEPYDKADKMPKEVNCINLTLTDFEIEMGRVFRSNRSSNESRNRVEPAGEHLCEEFFTSLREIPENLVSQEYVAAALAKVSEFANGHYYLGPSASPVHLIILAGIINEFLPRSLRSFPAPR